MKRRGFLKSAAGGAGCEAGGGPTKLHSGAPYERSKNRVALAWFMFDDGTILVKEKRDANLI